MTDRHGQRGPAFEAARVRREQAEAEMAELRLARMKGDATYEWADQALAAVRRAQAAVERIDLDAAREALDEAAARLVR